MQVDSLGKWTTDNVRFDTNIIWFVLYESDLSAELIRHVAQGNRVSLHNTGGKVIESWPLAGSSASIDALKTCVDGLTGEDDGNPFD